MTNPADANAELGRALAALRRKAGLTQAQAGASIEVSSKHLSAVETGQRGISWTSLMALLPAYRASLRELAELIERGQS
jgi:transcriptional regulator with XRE-family HTH domain